MRTPRRTAIDAASYVAGRYCHWRMDGVGPRSSSAEPPGGRGGPSFPRRAIPRRHRVDYATGQDAHYSVPVASEPDVRRPRPQTNPRHDHDIEHVMS